MIKKILKFLIGLFAVVVGLVPAMTFTVGASAAENGYASALQDLKKVETFDESVYEKIDGDASLSLITIAESIDNELYIYAYQPGATYTAASINISTDAKNTNNYQNKPLTLLSQDGVFQKYRVESVEVSTDETRVYEISTIFRPFDAEVDEPAADEGQTISEVSFPVGKRFEISADGMSVTDIELITVTDKYVGFMRYETFNILADVACDAHYIAFSTDKKMENLLEADVYYQSQSVHQYSGSTWGTEYGEIEDKYAHLSFDKTLDWVKHRCSRTLCQTLEHSKVIHQMCRRKETDCMMLNLRRITGCIHNHYPERSNT